jgi:hypothetical protein
MHKKININFIDPMITAEVQEFTGIRGRFYPPDASSPTEGIHNAVLVSDSGIDLWSGPVIVSDESGISSFELCVLENNASVMPWSYLPKGLWILDSGYSPVTEQKIEKLLDDIFTFPELATFHLHTPNSEGRRVHTLFFADEPIKNVSSIYFSHSSLTEKNENVPTILQIELFELTFFIIGICKSISSKYVNFEITKYIYQSSRRSAKRSIVDLEVGGTHFIEVSDFGAKILLENCKYSVGETIDIQIPKFESISGQIVYVSKEHSGKHELGLVITDSPSTTKNWFLFLTSIYFKNVTIRTPDDYEDLWALYNQSGYFSSYPAGKWLVESKNDVFNEWKTIDDEGPSAGVTIICKSADNKVVGSIGVAKVAKGCWVAQAAAVLKEPGTLDATRTIYAWRTRAIMMRQDGSHHLAFFSSDKPWLDRFFRNFYNANIKDHQKEIIWEEYEVFSAKSVDSRNISQSSHLDREKTVSSNFEFLNLLESNGTTTSLIRENELLQMRPHIHMCQYFSSVWTSNEDILEIINLTSEQYKYQSFFKIHLRTSKDDLKKIDVDYLVPEGKQVAWSCKRQLLPDFNYNSLKQLEIMIRKYGEAP